MEAVYIILFAIILIWFLATIYLLSLKPWRLFKTAKRK